MCGVWGVCVGCVGCVVIHDAGGFADAATGVDVCDGGERDSSARAARRGVLFGVARSVLPVLRCPRCGARRSVLFGAARAVLPAAVSCLAWPRAAVPKPHVQHSGSAWCRELFTPL